MNYNQNRSCVWITILLLLMLVSCGMKASTVLCIPTYGEGEAAADTSRWMNRDTGYRLIIRDQASLFTQMEIEKLSEEMKKVTDYGNAALITISDNDKTTRAYASGHAEELIGTNGTFLLIDLGNRNIYIYSKGTVWRTVTNSRARSITDNTYTFASQGEYYECAAAVFSQIVDLLEGRRITEPMRYACSVLLAILFGLLLNFIFIEITRSSLHRDYGNREDMSAPDEDSGITSVQIIVKRRVPHPRHSSGGHGGGGHGGGGGGHAF